jgi:hypothetical protein
MRGSGRKLRGHPFAQIVAAYCITAPTCNGLGLYYLPLGTIASDTGLTLEQVREGVAKMAEADFAYHDEEYDLVWIPEQAKYDLGASLKPTDRKHAYVIRQLKGFGRHRFVRQFLHRYAEAYNLPPLQEERKIPVGSPFEAPGAVCAHGNNKDKDKDKPSTGESACAPVTPSLSGPPSPAPGVPPIDKASPDTGRVIPLPRTLRATDDGVLGATMTAWCGGVSSVTGTACLPPYGRELHVLMATLLALRDREPGTDAIALSRREGVAYASANAGQKLNGWRFADWVRGGRPEGRARSGPIVQRSTEKTWQTAEEAGIYR